MKTLVIVLLVCGSFTVTDACAATNPGTTPGPSVTTTVATPDTTTTTAEGPTTTTTTTVTTVTTVAPGGPCAMCGDVMPITGGNLQGFTIAMSSFAYGMDAGGCRTAVLTCTSDIGTVAMDILPAGGDPTMEDTYLNLGQACKTTTNTQFDAPITCNAQGTWETVVQGDIIPDPQFGCSQAASACE